MLPTKGNQLVKSLQRSLLIHSNKLVSAAVPLTDPLPDAPSQHVPRIVHRDVKITQLENGIKVATVDNGGAVSRLCVALRGGSRNETSTQFGLSHLLKNAAFITNKERTDLRTVRELQQIGGTLECKSSRELISRNAVFMRHKLLELLENMAPGITQPIFNAWDLSDVIEGCQFENAIVYTDPNAVNLELLHQAAFRSGLGNSLYCENFRLGCYSPEQLEEYVQQMHVGERLTIVGTDVDHDELLRYVKELFGNLPRGQILHNTTQKYFGGEIHRNTGVDLTYVSLVTEGAGLFHANLPVLAVLQRILGSGPNVKWGSNQASSRINKAATAVTDGPLLINTLNISYSDAGLFGVNIITTPQAATPVLKAAVGQITAVAKGDVTAKEFERAKTQAKAAASMQSESNDDMLDDLVQQIAFHGRYTPLKESLANIDKVTLEETSKLTKHLLNGKASLAVTGDSSAAPYIDQLFI
ncbi:cytochrome b-c1 complex subunit 2, mitochondrial-like [Hydractinia symbiolongicarpus]|uniref:cytochrome b-c1 complex subunit 2, mitochondrial-like n=1 Tax=Hydractinia symbiolongicarpus TaxID=13093 RepID=UPI00254AC857|nr:cytochrome b-c1 complex subunit 2, mitochondrial-like [Hydractinia symbiolongicarpus]